MSGIASSEARTNIQSKHVDDGHDNSKFMELIVRTGETNAVNLTEDNQLSPEDNNGSVIANIEDTPVHDDPRKWSERKKLIILIIIAYSALAPTVGVFIYQPAIKQVKHDLKASDTEIALSLSLFILVQGNFPLIWSAISEIKGRKFVYLSALSIFIVGSAIGGIAKNIGVLIGMRLLQASGSSAVGAIGAGTLADIYAPAQRGTMIGIYYAAPLLSPALGPILGGAITQIWSWRATFYFLCIIGAIALASFLFFDDTFRRERSHTYQAAKRHAIERARRKALTRELDVERQEVIIRNDSNAQTIGSEDIKVTIVDLNPIRPVWQIIRRKNNLAIVFASSLLFAYLYCVCYTAARTFTRDPYNFKPVYTGLILLSIGLGSMVGSITGGRWSDRVLARAAAKENGDKIPEMRLNSTKIVMALIPPSILAYGWMCERKVHWAGPAVMLFISSFAVQFIYSATQAYIVDANTGRSSAAVATNSSFRGLAGMLFSQVAAPLQDSIGDGGLYTLWAGLLVVMELSIFLVLWKGQRWREVAERSEKRN